MTVTQLKYFVSICRNKSISKASEECFVSQPAISLAIKGLESEFGAILFYRRGNRLTLTQEGENLYGKATRLLAYYEEIEDEMNVARAHKSPLRLGIAPLLSIVYFPALAQKFAHVHPDISLELFEYGSERAHELVYNDELDFALVNMEFSDLEKFHRVELSREQLLLYVNKGNPLAMREKVTFEELKDCPLSLFNADSVQNQLIRSRFESLHIHPRVVMHVSQLATIKKFLDQDMVGAFLFGSLKGELGSYASIPIDPPIPVNVGIIWKKGKYITSDMRRFLEYVESLATREE